MTELIDPYDLGLDGLEALLASLGQPAYRAAQVQEWLTKGIDEPDEMTNLPATLRELLKPAFAAARPRLVAHRVADGGRTHKLLLEFPDGTAIETVLMLYPGRATVCISTQAGCAMGCPFCATGQAGLTRQLTAGEVIRQVIVADTVLSTGGLSGVDTSQEPWDLPEDHPPADVGADPAASSGTRVPSADDRAYPRRVTNVVFMGMGEPMANMEATTRTVVWLHEVLGLSARGITVSTVGLVPAIDRLAALGKPVTLAVSLHAANNALRDDLVPINRTHDLESLAGAMKRYREATNRRVTIEWCLIGGVNDSPKDARELAAFARRTRSHVNVIPMNPTPGVRWREPTPDVVRRFVADVEAAGGNITLRDTRGRDADAACGQLLASYTLGGGSRLPVAVGAADRVDERTRDTGQ